MCYHSHYGVTLLEIILKKSLLEKLKIRKKLLHVSKQNLSNSLMSFFLNNVKKDTKVILNHLCRLLLVHY